MKCLWYSWHSTFNIKENYLGRQHSLLQKGKVILDSSFSVAVHTEYKRVFFLKRISTLLCQHFSRLPLFILWNASNYTHIVFQHVIHNELCSVILFPICVTLYWNIWLNIYENTFIIQDSECYLYIGHDSSIRKPSLQHSKYHGASYIEPQEGENPLPEFFTFLI